MIIVAAVLGGVTYLLVGNAGPPAHLPRASGGLLVLTDGAIASPDADRVKVAAALSDTGYPGDARMTVTLTFPHPRRGLKWVVVASGQYQVSQTAPVDAFCRTAAVRNSSNEVTCPRDVFSGPPVLIYRRRDLAVTSPDGIETINDYDGYQPGASSMITGGLPSAEGSQPVSVEVAWPIRAVSGVTGGSATYGAFAPIAATDGEYGSRPPELSALDLTRRAQFADAVSLSPLNQPVVTAMSFDYQSDLGFDNIAYASPATVSSDRLAWNDPGISTSGMRYVLHDPVGEGDLLRRTFLGGVIGGLAASLLVWAVQLALERRARRYQCQ